MVNAREELLEHVGDREVEYVKVRYVRVCFKDDWDITIEGPLNSVLKNLDFTYDNGYGGQELFGYIWYKDGTWSERGEYDGKEWWRHIERPPLDVEIADS